MKSRHLLLAATALVVAACGDDASGPPADTPVPAGDTAGAAVDGAWDVVALQVDGRSIALLDDWPVTMSIDGDMIGGTAACNGYGGTVAIGVTDGSFVVGDLAQTEMACVDDGVMELESDFLAALARVDSYELGEGLVLTAGEGATAIELDPQPEVIDAELTGTAWVLDTVLTDEWATNSTVMEDVVLEFADDGTLTGSTGCRRLEGTWQLDGDRLQVPSLAALDDEPASACSSDAAEIERVVVSVLESNTEVVIEGDRLTLTAPGGEGISLRAT